MASVGKQTDLASWIDKSLESLTGQWSAIPRIVSDWDKWDELERLDFVIEWPLTEDRLRQLERWRAEGMLSTDQRQRFADLEVLIEHNRAALKRLIAD